MNFQIFLNLVGAETVLGLASRKECARARASVAHALSLSREFLDYLLFLFFSKNIKEGTRVKLERLWKSLTAGGFTSKLILLLNLPPTDLLYLQR
jgi:hypothetical protein